MAGENLRSPRRGPAIFPISMATVLGGIPRNSLVDRFLALQASPQTRRVYASDLRDLVDLASVRDWSFPLLDEDQALTWRADMENRHLAPVTIARKLAVARSFFEYLLDLDPVPAGLPARNPFRRVRPPRFDRSLGKTPCPSPEEVRRLLAVMKPRSTHGLRDRLITLLLFNQGLRVSEVARLERANIQKYGELTVLTLVGKGGSEIRSVLAPAVADLLARYLRRQGDHGRYLFAGQGGHRERADRSLTPRAIHQRLKHYVHLAGLNPAMIRPHSGRVFFITQSYLKTHDLERVARAVGHRAIATTRRYLRLGEILETHPAALIDLTGKSIGMRRRAESEGRREENPKGLMEP